MRALITSRGNPVALDARTATGSTPRWSSSSSWSAVDVYVNETTRHADVILPAPSPLRRAHYDLALYLFAVRNVANYSPPVLEPEPELPDEWVTLLRLAGVAAGLGPDADVADARRAGRADAGRSASSRRPESPVAGRDADELLAALEPRVGPERLLDLMLRAGPYGDGFGARNDGPGSRWPRSRPPRTAIDLGPLRAPAARRAAHGQRARSSSPPS